jgi:uncharacterized membrane protein YczE
MTGLTDLGPIAQLRAGRLGRRLPQLFVGLYIYGLSQALMIQGGVGLAPWDVLHSGLTEHLPIDFGVAVVASSFVVLLFWIPLREMPGIGTIANALMIGTSADLSLTFVPQMHGWVGRYAFMLAGVALCGLATAMYIGAQFGRGPRDGLMTGLHRKTGLSLRLVRTGLEVTVTVIGLLLGGSLGIGTVVFALTIGPMTQKLLPFWIVPVCVEPVRPRPDVTGQRVLRDQM